MTSTPRSIHSTRLQVSRIERIEWLTRNTVPAPSRIARMRASLRSRNAWSPTASASSTMRISWSRAVAMANFSRAVMPEE